MFFTLGVLVVPGLCAAAAMDPNFLVLKATHSNSVQLPEPPMDDAKDCAQHLGELLMEGLYVDDTNIPMFSLEPEKVVADENRPLYFVMFRLSNKSIRHPKTAIIHCTRYALEESE